MAKIEHGEGELISVDTNAKTLKFREISYIATDSASKEWECPYVLDWEDQRFFELVGMRVEYVLSDGKVVNLKPHR